MWTCPKCGRTFARNGQDHYCGKPPETIDEYILNQPEKAQPLLKEINETIRAAIPDTMEKISWSMPTYWKKRNLIQFAAFKNHVGLYPGPEAVEKFADRLTGYQTQRGRSGCLMTSPWTGSWWQRLRYGVKRRMGNDQ